MSTPTRPALALLLAAAALPAAAAAGKYPAAPRVRPQPAPLVAPLLLPAIDGVTNGSFESNGGTGTSLLTGWTTVSLPSALQGEPGEGNWYVQSGSTAPLSGLDVAPPTQGLFAAMSDSLSAGAHLLYQDITVPSEGLRLVCDLYVKNDAGFYNDAGSFEWGGGSNQMARIDLLDPTAPVDDLGAGVLENIYHLGPGDPNEIPYQPLPIDLSPYAGQTVRLRFAQVDNEGILNIGVDNCRSAVCVPDEETACLLSGRFEVKVQWTDFGSQTGPAKLMYFGSARAESDQSAFFWFFTPTNFEMGIKMVDACVEPYNAFWVFVSGLTNVQYIVTIRDTVTEAVQTYSNPLGLLPTTEGDTQAFGCP